MEEGSSNPFSDSSTLNGGTDENAADGVNVANASTSAPSNDEEEAKRRIRAADSKKGRIYETARWLRQYRNVEIGEDSDIYAYDEDAGVWRGRDDGDDGKQVLRELIYDVLGQDYDRALLRSVIEHLKAHRVVQTSARSGLRPSPSRWRMDCSNSIQVHWSTFNPKTGRCGRCR